MGTIAYQDTGSNTYVDRASTTWVTRVDVISVQTSLTQPYHLFTPVSTDLIELYSLLVGASTTQLYSFLDNVANYLTELYGMKLGASNTQLYRDADNVLASLTQYYRDAGLLASSNTQKYGVANLLNKSLTQKWFLSTSLIKSVEQQYAILASEVHTELRQPYDEMVNAKLTKDLNQLYLIVGGSYANTIPLPLVVVGGTSFDYDSIDFEGHLNTFCMSATLGFQSYDTYKRCKIDSDISITVGSTTVELFVEGKSRSRQVNNPIKYSLQCLSKSAKLAAPYATTVDGDLGGKYASEIATELASPYDITIIWNVWDEYYPLNILFGNGQTPLDIIRKMASAVGGLVQTYPNGTVYVVKWYPKMPTEWETTAPAAYLTDSENFFSTEEQPDMRSGNNKYAITNTVSSDSKIVLEEEEISSSQKYVKVYQVPWVDGEELPFTTSGGSHVIIYTEAAWLTGDFEELVEKIEIKGGIGNVSKPIYGLVSFEYHERHLGNITPGTDGSVTSETDGYSLVTITYNTRFRKWRVTDSRIEEVQFIVGDDS